MPLASAHPSVVSLVPLRVPHLRPGLARPLLASLVLLTSPSLALRSLPPAVQLKHLHHLRPRLPVVLPQSLDRWPQPLAKRPEAKVVAPVASCVPAVHPKARLLLDPTTLADGVVEVEIVALSSQTPRHPR